MTNQIKENAFVDSMITTSDSDEDDGNLNQQFDSLMDHFDNKELKCTKHDEHTTFEVSHEMMEAL